MLVHASRGTVTFIGLKLHRNLLLLDGALHHAGVVHDGRLAVQGGPARVRAEVLHQDAEPSVGAHSGPLVIDLHLHADVLRHGRGVGVWLAAVAAGGLDRDAFLLRT